DQTGILTRKPERIHAGTYQRGDQALVHRTAEYHPRDGQSGRRSQALPLTPLNHDPEALRERIDLGTTAMHDDQWRGRTGRLGGEARQPRGIAQRASTDLDHARLHISNPSVSPSPSARLAFCNAWPAAPFNRLSIAATTRSVG